MGTKRQERKLNKMRALLLLTSLTLFGCNENINWKNLEKVYFFEKKPENFETSKPYDLIQLSETKELKIDIIKKRLKNSKYEDKKYIWKGGSHYIIAIFSEGEDLRLKVSSRYGMYQELSTSKCYSIKGFETLDSMNWEELIIKE